MDSETSAEPRSHLYAGISDLELAEDSFDLGEGIILRKTYAHVMAPVLMAFTRPEEGKHHPGPWKTTTAHLGFDITAELCIPSALEKDFPVLNELVQTFVFLIRVGLNPSARLAVFSKQPFSDVVQALGEPSYFLIHDVQPRRFEIVVEGADVRVERAEWLKRRWRRTHEIMKASAEFALAAEAYSTGQFIKNSGLILVSLWGALEALFSPSTSELKFRVSALIAAYLEPPGENRLLVQRGIAKLYDKRSAAAHGKPSHDFDHLLQTYLILQRVLTTIVDRGRVPSKDELEKLLFGMPSEAT